MSELPKYHQIISNALETTGNNIGLVQDTELAHQAALSENALLNNSIPPSKERMDEMRNDYLKAALAKSAVKKAAENDLDNLAIAGAFDKPNLGINSERLVNEATRVASDFDLLENLSQAAAETRKNDAEFLDLSSHEFTIALAEAPVYRKNVIVKARKAVPGELVVTITPSGLEESRNIAKGDDYVVTGANGADFILPSEKFTKLYEATDDEGMFQSRGMAKIIDNPTGDRIGVVAPWNPDEIVYGEADSKLAVQFDANDPEIIGTDRYILDKDEFSAYKVD